MLQDQVDPNQLTKASAPGSASAIPVSQRPISGDNYAYGDDDIVEDDNIVARDTSVCTPGNELTGRWTRKEHDLFIEAIKKFGKEWKKVASWVGTRTVLQTTKHSQRYFQKVSKCLSGNMSDGDDTGNNISARGKRKQAEMTAAHVLVSSSSGRGPSQDHTGAETLSKTKSKGPGASYRPGEIVRRQREPRSGQSSRREDVALESMSNCSHHRDKQCLEPFAYLNQIPGKDIRGALIDCFNEWLQLPSDKIVVIKDIISSLHNASLLVDDIEDNSKLRRGLPVAHSIFGVANTINCANYVYFLALQRCYELNNKDAMNAFVLELLNLHRGQGQDIIWRDSVRCPSEEQYKSMVLDKTGGLFRLAVGIMQPFCTACSDYNFTNLLNSLSLYFQIRDDFLNISSVAYMQTKSFCEDLTEGKFSFPIIHAVNSNPEDTQLLNILRQRTEDTDVKRYAVAYMENVGSIAYTREILKELKKRVEDEVISLGGHSNLITLITKLDEELDKTTSIKDIMTTKLNFPSMPSPSRVSSGSVTLSSGSSDPSTTSKVSTL